jgi:hypothetical protein
MPETGIFHKEENNITAETERVCIHENKYNLLSASLPYT